MIDSPKMCPRPRRPGSRMASVACVIACVVAGTLAGCGGEEGTEACHLAAGRYTEVWTLTWHDCPSEPAGDTKGPFDVAAGQLPCGVMTGYQQPEAPLPEGCLASAKYSLEVSATGASGTAEVIWACDEAACKADYALSYSRQ